jgi:hypothetical protein
MSILPNLYYAWKGTKHLKADELHKKYGQFAGWPCLELSLTPIQETLFAWSLDSCRS